MLGTNRTAGHESGRLRAGVAAETGLSATEVIFARLARHSQRRDGRAGPKLPGQRPIGVIFSLGTWALMGVNRPCPCVNDKVLALNFTNEGAWATRPG